MKAKRFALPLLALLFLALCGCGGGGYYKYDTLAYFNAPCRWAFSRKDESAEKEVWRELTSLFSEVENALSLSVETSDLSRFNRASAGERVEISIHSYDVLMAAMRMYRRTEGAFNPAAGRYVDLWGFSPRVLNGDTEKLPYDRAEASVPDSKYLTAFSALLDFSALQLSNEDGRFYATKPNSVVLLDGVEYTMQLDLGGIAKGYACDKGAELVLRNGYNVGFLSVGQSSMRLFSREGNDDWQIEVNSPRTEIFKDRYLSAKAKETGVSTSGDYENYFMLEGRRYCHIINPFTGYPVNASPIEDGSGVVSASVFGVSALEGDAISTAICVKGAAWAKSFLEEYYPAAKVLITSYNARENRYFVTTNFEEGQISSYADGLSVEAL